MNGIDIKLIDHREHKRIYRKMGKEGEERLEMDFGGKSRNYEKQLYGCI